MMRLLQIDTSIPRIFAHAVCRRCGGQCCESYPGSASPIQFGAPNRKLLIERLVDAFMSGQWQVDWWEGKERGYFVRPAVAGDTRIKSPTWGGRCVFLGSKGCAFAAKNRPAGCLNLRPDPPEQGGKGCLSEFGHKLEWANLWKPYWDEIDAAVEAVTERERGAA